MLWIEIKCEFIALSSNTLHPSIHASEDVDVQDQEERQCIGNRRHVHDDCGWPLMCNTPQRVDDGDEEAVAARKERMDAE